jgi:hypothetical protein
MVLWSDIEDTFVGGSSMSVENTPALPPGEGRAHLGAAKLRPLFYKNL